MKQKAVAARELYINRYELRTMKVRRQTNHASEHITSPNIDPGESQTELCKPPTNSLLQFGNWQLLNLNQKAVHAAHAMDINCYNFGPKGK